ncbi:hypothetical protein Sango_1478700 [Sesamum angolense]|uniref:Aminotransferase-like plant mobile domain-containing protein n=1 Tax=Sesamum angolense TaxID=2727404 RepID=A0AAE1WNB0_9LAMI|nr:hypothetical protein Sango_1478700 [Sesamum angolense]
MVYFKDKSSPSGENHLIILGNQNQPLEKGTMLAVYAPLIGGYWEWTEDVLSRCGDRLRHLKIYDAVYASLFTYDHNSDIVKAFCEAWCPLTNTLHTSAGEMSISLWDLHELVGLPMTGCLYDEVVPSALELTGVDEKRERFIPRSCKYLLYAYHLLQSADDDRCSHVSIDKWVKFWSKKTAKYHPPPPRKEKKTVRPKSTHNPLGDIATHERWSTAEDALFAKLCIERSLKEEVYLAAYLACWLCLFVLPAIPVLASIYEGLNTIATSPKPAELRGPKMTRFSGEGGAKYYEPREARKRIHKAEFVSWACNMLVKAEPFKFIVEPYSPHRFGRQFGYYQDVPRTLKYDTRVASLEEGLRYWRLCVLSKSSSKAWFPCLPANAKKLCSEAYKAWWAKIHGTFFDDNIACLIRPKSIKITLKRKKDEDKQVDGGENDPPHALIPPIVIECDSQAAIVEVSKGKCSSHNVADSDSSNKDRHWKRQRKETMPLKATETNENASRSSLANFVAELEDEVQSIDVGEESETSHSSTMTPPLGMGLKRKQSSPPAAVSVLKGESFLFNYQKEFLQRLWSGLIVKISNTPIDFLSSIEDDVHLILESMKSFQKFDISKVEESLNMFFAKVRAYDEARSLSSEKLSQSLHKQQLKEVKARLQDVQAKASEEASEIQSVMDELEHVEEDIAVLKGQRTNLRATLKEKKQLNHDTQAKVHEVEKDLAALESTGPLDDAIVQNLESSRANLGILTEDLKSLNPFA